MRGLPDNAFALAIADPPYGMPPSASRTWSDKSALKDRAFSRGKIGETWDKAPPPEFFAELRRVSENQIIWGGNYFDLPPTRCVVCWDKCQPWENFSQWEMAWTSFDKPAPLFRFDNRTPGKIHPTQKPVELYSWLLGKFWTGGVVFDPMMGSQSSRIAA
jgi:site-specific DNA-methyltransferase (adenine-specific)